MGTRFMHTSDWQLGVTRHFLSAESQARWSEARFEAVRRLGRLAKEERCEFVVVAGDVFESNQVDRRTVLKACDALASFPIPVYLLPGNHDPLDASSVFRSRLWRERIPGHVHVLDEAGKLFEVRPGVEVVGAPWTSKRPLADLVGGVAAGLAPAAGAQRVMVGHGAVDQLSPDRDNPALVLVADAERALREERYHYLALGDRHSFTRVGDSGRIFYSGTQEAYDFDEVDPGKALFVELEADRAEVTPAQVGAWRFLVHEGHLSTTEDVEALSRHLEAMSDKERTVLKLGLVGTLGLQAHARLEEIEGRARDLFAAVVRSESRSELAVLPADADFENLALGGFAASTLAKLREQAQRDGEAGEQAAGALALLVRLAGRMA